MSFNSALSPNVVKTDLDAVFFQEFEKVGGQHYVDATSPMIFNQSTATNGAVQVETFGGIGLWGTRAEEENLHKSTPRITNKATYTVSAFADSVVIPKHFFDDQMHGSYELMVRNFAEMAKVSRDRAAMKFWVDGFSTNTTADGANIFSNSHTTISGDTVDNIETAALSATSLNTALVSLMKQKDQAGVVRGKMGKCLLVPPDLFKTACELSDAELRPNTANNEPNVFLTKFGIYVATSPHLSNASTGVSGADAFWYVLAENHAFTRYVRESVHTNLRDYIFSENYTYNYSGEFREVIGCQDYVGLVASNGTT